MNLFKTISRLKWASIFRLLWLSLPNILLLWPTYRATKECMQISSKHFGRKHYQNGQANAFRHALWNILIAKKSFRPNTSAERVLVWAKRITDWHEEAFFSKELPMKMDYHNNAVGRNIFKKNLQWSQEEFINHLRQLTLDAVKINRTTDLDSFKNQLVYIKNDN